MDLLQKEFTIRHGLGSSTYRVARHHRDAGYYECVEIDGPLQQLIGGIEIFHGTFIERALAGVA